jgi:FkbM family methyltransferase
MIISLDKVLKDYNLKINGVLHIGAHWGQEYQEYLDNGIKDVIFFEPIESNYKKLRELMPMGVRCENIALGNETGQKNMYVETANGGMSCSVLEPGTHLTSYPNITFDLRESVRMDKLDNIDFERTRFDMINIDVQGYELEVFKGAVKTLPFIKLIYTEVNTNEVYKGCCLMVDIDNFLRDFGFRRVLESFPLSPTWGDAIYIR